MLAAAVLAGGAASGEDRTGGLAELARSRTAYLVVDAGAAALEVHVSGYRFASHPLIHSELSERAGPCEPATLDTHTPSTPDTPPKALVLRVAEDAAAPYRATLAPAQLVTPEGAGEPVSGEADGGEPAAPAAPETALTTPPSTYDAGLDGNWRLVVSTRPPSGVSRLAEAIGAGWQRLRGRALSGCELRLTLAAEDARSLHHRLRPGTAIAVLSPPAPPPG